MPVGGDTTTNHACGATMKSSFHDNNERSIERVVGIGRWRSAQCLCEATQQPTILRDDDVVVPRRQRWPQRGRGGGRTLPRSGGESTRVAQRDARFESHVVSDGPDGESSRRPWYSPAGGGGRGDGNAIPDVNDQRLARYDVERRREIVSRLLASTRSESGRVGRGTARHHHEGVPELRARGSHRPIRTSRRCAVGARVGRGIRRRAG